MIAFWLAAAASASTVAVLPFDMSAGADDWKGLGTALSGLVVTDLSTVHGITLVERQKLDAVTGELALSKGGFIDPATAQQLGHGLGAERLVTGSFAVIGAKFVLDARIVDVGTGQVLSAADGEGGVDDFVSVEKHVVDGLLTGLAAQPTADERQKLLATSTHSLEALADYGRALDAQKQGDAAGARVGFTAAVTADPGFRAAADALSRLRSTLDATVAADADRRVAEHSKQLDAVLAAVPDERTRTGARDTIEDLGALALRWSALEALGRECERYAEMRHYGDRHGWAISLPKGGYAAAVNAATTQGVALGLSPSDKQSPSDFRDFQFQVQTGPIAGLGDLSRFLYQFPSSALTVRHAPDLLTAMTRCFSPAEQEVELAQIRAAVDGKNLGAAPTRDFDGATLDETLDLTALWIRAGGEGVDVDATTRLQDALHRHPDGDPAHFWIVQQIRQVIERGEATERARVAKVGLGDSVLDGIVAAIAAKDPQALALDNATCAKIFDRYQPWAKATLDERKAPGWVASERGVGATVAPMRDLGCLSGVPGRFQNTGDAMVFVRNLAGKEGDPPTPACAEQFKTFDQRVANETTGEPAYVADDLLAYYYSLLVLPLCVQGP